MASYVHEHFHITADFLNHYVLVLRFLTLKCDIVLRFKDLVLRIATDKKCLKRNKKIVIQNVR